MKTNYFLAAAACVALFVNCTDMNEPFDWQGHRGARGKFPENTLPAFTYALDQGMRTLELDLAVSKDKQLIVSHEPWMNSTICLEPNGERIQTLFQREHNLYLMDVDTIKTYDCGTLRHKHFPEQQNQKVYKPTLAEVVETSDEHARHTGRELPRYNIEIKHDPSYDNRFAPPPAEFVELVIKEVDRLGIAGRSTIQSFDRRVLQELYRQQAPTDIAYLVERPVDLTKTEATLGFMPDIWSPYFPLVSDVNVTQAHELGMRVVPWTVNDTTVMHRLIEDGVDGIITDYPDRAAGIMAGDQSPLIR